MPEARIIDGNAFSTGLRAQVAEQVGSLRDGHGLVPGLAVIIVGADPASQVYVKSKHKRAVEAGMNSFEYALPEDTSEQTLLALVDQLNRDAAVHGILVQLPLPRHIDTDKVIEAISPAKDVDGFHPWNAGRLATGGAALVPCTPLGCLMLLRDVLPDMSGLKALVLGRSNIVGKPMAQLLLRESCTVTIAHSRTRDLPGEVRQADILVAAIGKPNFVPGAWLKPGATVIDVGINRIPAAEGKTRLVGDVDFDSAKGLAGAITPVPGGVGPMTIACLLRNTLVACARQHDISLPDRPIWQ